MRDLLVFLTVLLCLPLAWQRPFVGLLLFSWLAYMRPQDLCWGFARDMRLSYYVGLTMVVGWFVNERGLRPFTRWDVRTRLMVALCALVVISYGQARHHTDYYNRYFFEFLKIIVVALFTIGQVDSRQRLRLLLWTIALCLGFYGFKGGLFGILRGGAPILRGPGGMLEDNNDFALALVMNIPLLWYLGRTEPQRWIRTATRVAILLTVITVALTHSRGAFLALCATALWIAWRSGHLFQAGAALAGAAVSFLVLAPAHVLERLATLQEGTQESSAGARITAWSTALRMIEANPVFGVGLRNFQPRYLEYALLPPTGKNTTYVAHNSYLQIWAESGTLAFACYLGLLGSVFWMCRRVMRLARRRPDLAWSGDYARLVEATTVAFMVGAMFLNRGHFDLVYHWFAVASCLWLVVSRAVAAKAAAPAKAATPRGVTIRFAPTDRQQPIWGRAH